jgi:hypothetical protein
VGLHILFIGIVDVICRHQIDAGLTAHPDQLGIDFFLVIIAVILKFQKEIIFPKDLFLWSYTTHSAS